MAYKANLKKAEMWAKAIQAGVKVFKSIEQQTKTEGFSRPILMQIMTPVFPFFEQLDPEEVEEVFRALEHMTEDFWKDYNQIFVVEAKQEFPDDEIELPDTVFVSTLVTSLDIVHLYDKLLDVD